MYSPTKKKEKENIEYAEWKYCCNISFKVEYTKQWDFQILVSVTQCLTSDLL